MGMPGPQRVSRYGIEFKLRAVKMSEAAGVLVKDVAESPSQSVTKSKNPKTMPLPSEYEEYSGEVFDPTLHLAEIEQANTVLANFVSAMEQSRVPAATLSDIEAAVCTLGKYAGYSAEAHQMEMFLESKLAANYRTTSNVLQGFIQIINHEIRERLEASASQKHSKSAQHTSPSIQDKDLPF